MGEALRAAASLRGRRQPRAPHPPDPAEHPESAAAAAARGRAANDRDAGPRRAGPGLIRQDADGLVADSRALAAILEELLLAADTRTPVPAEPVDLTGLVTEAVSAAQASADERSLALRTVVGGPVVIPAGSSTALGRDCSGGQRPGPRAELRRGVGQPGAGPGDHPGQRRRDREFLTSYSPASSNGSPAGRTPSSAAPRHYGLGLALASEVARSHGGDVTARDTTGSGGAVLSLVLPLRRPATRTQGSNSD